MRDIRQEFDEYIKGSDELYWWMKEIEQNFNDGKKVNKTKYNKIKILEAKQRQKAIELLEAINENNYVQTCMPPRIPYSFK